MAKENHDSEISLTWIQFFVIMADTMGHNELETGICLLDFDALPKNKCCLLTKEKEVNPSFKWLQS